jgi:hypothetical protein
MGNCLGELTDEIRADHPPGVSIKHFCSIGPKSYAYVLTNEVEEVKAKGIPKDPNVNYNLYKRMVTAKGGEKIVHKVKIKLGFKRCKFTGRLRRVEEEKTVQLTYDKRIIIDNYRTRPYGTKQK